LDISHFRKRQHQETIKGLKSKNGNDAWATLGQCPLLGLLLQNGAIKAKAKVLVEARDKNFQFLHLHVAAMKYGSHLFHSCKHKKKAQCAKFSEDYFNSS